MKPKAKKKVTRTMTLWIEVSDYAKAPMTHGEYFKKEPITHCYHYKKVKVSFYD